MDQLKSLRFLSFLGVSTVDVSGEVAYADTESPYVCMYTKCTVSLGRKILCPHPFPSPSSPVACSPKTKNLDYTPHEDYNLILPIPGPSLREVRY